MNFVPPPMGMNGGSDILTMTNPCSNSSLNLLSGRLLARNTIWNVVGNCAPMMMAVFSVPIVIHGLGNDRFGILALAWALIGYAGLFDLGVGRALTQLVAKKLGADERRDLPSLAWTSLLLMLSLGFVGGAAALAVSPWLVHHALKIPGGLQLETLRSFYLLSLSMPAVITTAGLRGLLEAHQRFAVVNVLRLPMGVLNFIGPLTVLPFSHTLVPVVAVLVLGRFLGCGAHVWACVKAMPELRHERWFDASAIPSLLSFGGWMTVSNVLGPLMLYLDRFLIGSVLSLAAVAYYTAPVDIVLRFAVIPNAVVGVLFPAFAMSLHRDSNRSALLLARGLKCVYLAIFPIALFLVTFAHEILRLWLGRAFEHEGAAVLAWVAIGAFVTALSTIPFTLIQSAGRPDVTAWLLVAELPLYSALLWWMTRWRGIHGTALAWMLRLIAEAIFVFIFSYYLLPQKPKFLLGLAATMIGGVAILFLASLPQDQSSRIALFSLTSVGFAAAAWSWGLTPVERLFLRRSPTNLSAPIHAD